MYNFLKIIMGSKFKLLLLILIGVVGFTGMYSNSKRWNSQMLILPKTPSSHITGGRQLDVIITFPALFDTQEVQLKIHDTSETRKKQRMNEYIVCLRRTLSHRYVSKVHVLYDQDVLPAFINSNLDSELKSKLNLQKVNHSIGALTAFTYIYSNLQGRLVMLKQADSYPGDGLDLLDKNMIEEKKLMYAVTRRGQLEDTCNMRDERRFPTSNTCHDKKYHGSHDAYIFVPRGPLPSNVTDSLKDLYNYSYGIDNLTIGIFRHIFKHTVLNPCKVIHMYHFHCSNVRNKSFGKSTSTKEKAPPTDQLS